MSSPEYPPISTQLEQIPTEHLRVVEMDRRKYQQLADIALKSPQISLEDFEQGYNSVFSVSEQQANEDPEHGYKVTAAFEQLQSTGEIGLNPVSQEGDNATFEVVNYQKPLEPQTYRQAKRAAAQSSRKTRKAYDANPAKKPARGTEISWTKTLFGNRKVQASNNRSATMGEELNRVTTPSDDDGRITRGTKQLIRTWGKDSIAEHTGRLDKAASAANKRALGIAKRNALPEIDPAVAEWASKRDTVVKFVGRSATQSITGGEAPRQQTLANMRNVLFTEASVTADIRAAYDAFTAQAAGSGMSPEEGLALREQIIRAQAQKSVTRLAGNSPAPANIIASYADLLLQQYAGELGRNTIRDYEDLKKQLASA